MWTVQYVSGNPTSNCAQRTPPWLIERKRSEGGTSQKKIKKQSQPEQTPQQQVRNGEPAPLLK